MEREMKGGGGVRLIFKNKYPKQYRLKTHFPTMEVVRCVCFVPWISNDIEVWLTFANELFYIITDSFVATSEFLHYSHPFLD